MKRIKELLYDYGYKAKDLAKYLGVSSQAVNSFINEKTQPKTENCIKIAEYFNVSLDYLFGVSDTKNRSSNIQGVCEKTGLSEKAVKILFELNNKKPESISLISEIIEVFAKNE